MKHSSIPAIAWTIAGSDSGGGAGIQADLATFRDFGVHGCSAITALTAQNSLGVTDIAITSPGNLRAQLKALADDLPAGALKLGMLADADTVALVSDFLDGYSGKVVCDPVMISTSGSMLQDEAGGRLLRERLLPRADLITPNRHEAEALLGRTLHSAADIETAAADLLQLGPRSVLIKGGHFDIGSTRRRCDDYWTDGRDAFWLSGPRIDTNDTHGTGCSLAAAVAAALAQDLSLLDALVLAKMYVSAGLRVARTLGQGPGPVGHVGSPRRIGIQDLPTLSRSLPSGQHPAFPDCGGELGLYPVVDSAAWIERLLPLGVTTIQLRIKDQPAERIEQQIVEAVALSRRYNARLFINDYWQLAIRHGAYGVHLGQEDLDSADLDTIRRAGLRLGISNHSYYEIARAHGIRPSYMALGPIFPTTTKVMKFSDQGLIQLREWAELLKPVYTLTAIGGINRERAPAVLASGAGSCAMVTAITLAADVEGEVKHLLQLHRSAAAPV